MLGQFNPSFEQKSEITPENFEELRAEAEFAALDEIFLNTVLDPKHITNAEYAGLLKNAVVHNISQDELKRYMKERNMIFIPAQEAPEISEGNIKIHSVER